MNDLLLEIVRNDFSITDSSRIETLSTKDWEDLFRLAHKLKISPLFCEAVREHVPIMMMELYDQYMRKQVSICNAIKIALGKISTACNEEKQRFVLFKGVAASCLIYGNETDRQVGDIDILVANEDLFRMDYALRKAGFFQPDIAIGLKAKSRQLSRLLQYRSCMSIPYPRRRRSSSDQFIPYYDADYPCRVEVHDGYKSLPKAFISETLWSVTKLKIGNAVIRVPDINHLFVLLLITAHANSHGYFAAADGELNLRDYVDIHYLIKNRFTSLDFRAILEIIVKHNLCRIATETISLHKQIYIGERFPFLETGLGLIENFDDSYFLDRLFYPAACSELAIAEIKSRCSIERAKGEENLHVQLVKCEESIACQNRFGLDISCSVEFADNGMVVQWKLPQPVVNDLNLFAFKLAFVPSVAVPYLEFSIGSYSPKDKTVSSCWNKTNRLAPRFVPEFYEGHAESALVHKAGASFLVVTIPASMLDIAHDDRAKGIGLIPCVYLRDSPNSFCDINANIEYSDIRYVLT